MKKFIVVEPYQSNYLNPITLKKGQVLVKKNKQPQTEWSGWLFCSTNDKEGWVPEQIIQKNDQGELVSLKAYTARELDVLKGEEVARLEEMNGWFWCERIGKGDSGWLPAEILRPI